MGTVTRLVDGLANVLTGRGTSVDRSSYNFWARRFTTPQQVEAAYLGSWLHRKIVDVPAEDMTRAGRDWDADDGDIEKIEAEEKRLGYWAKLREATRFGRLGGGAILIGLGDNPSLELPKSVKAGQVQYLMVLSRWQLGLGDMETDLLSPNYGQPRYFRLSGGARQVDIHPSRIVCFHGLPVPPIHMSTWEDRFWGMSVVEACDEAVQQATTACTGFASLIDEAKIDVWKLSGIVDTLSQPGGDKKLSDRINATNAGKSNHRAVILDKDDDWEQRQLTLTGVRDVIITYDARVAGAADIPATRLFGKAPDGQNSTGEGDLANYFQGIGARQEMTLRPAMERLDAVILPSAGVADASSSWSFSPLRVLTEKEAAEIEWNEAQAVEKYANTGLVPETAMAKAVQNRLIESQRWPGLQGAIEEAEAAGEDLPDDPADLGVVPVPGAKGGDPASAGQGGSQQQQLPRRAVAANDAAPRSLYVSRKLLNADELIKWAKAQGFDATLAPGDMHVTVLFSRAAVDWMKMGSPWSDDAKGELTVAPGGARLVEPLGDKGAVVLLFNSSALSWRHEDMVRNGASHDFAEYQPHVTITYTRPDGLDLTKVEPYRGELRFGPEVFEEVNDDWASNIEEG